MSVDLLELRVWVSLGVFVVYAGDLCEVLGFGTVSATRSLEMGILGESLN